MILYGPSIQRHTDIVVNSQATLSISELTEFNSVTRTRKEKEINKTRHNRERETPLPIYTGLSLHAKTRSRDLVDIFYDLGLSISYDRVLSISSDLGNAVCRQYKKENVVCPPNLKIGLFTTTALDNLDHNPSSMTAKESFHGTGISMFQNQSELEPGIERERILDKSGAQATKSVEALPEVYTDVQPVDLPKTNPPIPKMKSQMQGEGGCINKAIEDEMEWLQSVYSDIEGKKVRTKPDQTKNNEPSREVSNTESNLTIASKKISWSSYHASNQRIDQNARPAITSLLPLLPDEAKSPAIIIHTMNISKNCIQRLNPGQTPVIAMDQPLFAVAKQIQWHWSEHYGEKHFVIMFGGLHIEMDFMKAIGSWLCDSGWTIALTDAGVASPGSAESFLKASKITRTRRAHQVTACSLHILLHRAYESYIDSLEEGSVVLSFQSWCDQQCATIPQFQFWHIALELELLLLTFVRSIRQANFDLYCDALSKMVPWFFSMNCTNYARWIPIHLRDMFALKDNAPDVALEFRKGNFTVSKTTCRFSAMAIDQAHEQNNALVKGDRGAVGLTENPNAL